MNTVTLVGNITKDLELRFTPSGKAVVKFSMAVAQFKDKEGNWISDFFNCIVWNKLAENASESLCKGSKVIVVGKLYVEKWEDKEGNKRQMAGVRVDSLGADLSFATCEIRKNSRPEGNNNFEEDDGIPF
jgi:single-strand DNA-binding protein